MRILYYLFVVGSIVVFLSSCNAVYSGSMLFIKPGKNKPLRVKDTLDYSKWDSWFSHPIKTKDAADGNFLNVIDGQDSARAAVFFIHPTSYFSSKSWNKSVDYDSRDPFLERIVLPNQLTVFVESYQVYAPKYPQATLASFFTQDKKGEKALSLATDHLEIAFREFIRQIGDKPFIIAGHSQGSYHVVGLLRRMVIGTELEKRMVTALAPGYPFPLDYLKDQQIALCASESQIGCLELWNVLKYRADFINRLNKGPLPDSERRLTKKDRLAVTNPIKIGKMSCEKTENTGAYLGGFETPNTPFVPGLVGADVDTLRGVIRIQKPGDKRFRKFLMGPGWYHQYEYSLYFSNIMERMNKKLKVYVVKMNENIKNKKLQ